MRFSKNYPLPGTNSEDSLLLTWEKDYKNIKVYYDGNIIDKIENPASLHEGYKKTIDGIGLMELTFNKKPVYIDVSIDGKPCPFELDEENNDLKSIASYFWVLFGLSVIGTIIEGAQLGMGSIPGILATIVNTLFTAVYLVAAIFTYKGNPWAYYMGTFTFLFTTLMFLLISFFFFNYVAVVQLIIRGAILIGLFANFKMVRSIHKLSKKNSDLSIDLLDT